MAAPTEPLWPNKSPCSKAIDEGVGPMPLRLKFTRRCSALAAVAGLATFSAFAMFTAAWAQSSGATGGAAYPSRPITLIVPYAAGGNVDAVARWAPSVVKYDGLKDFAPVTLLSSSPLVLVGRPGLPANNLDELLKLMRKEPGKLNYATSGIGTSLHVAGEMFNQLGKVQMVHVPYKIGSQIVTDLMGNQIDLAMLPIPLTSEQVKAGRIKAFGVTEVARSPGLPDVPSMAEHPQLKGLEVTVWFGLFAPAKTDPAVVARLAKESAEMLKDEALRQKLAAIGMRPLGLPPEAFAKFLDAEQRKFGDIVRVGNIRAE
ncbi:MAG: hypothetical protein EBS16_07750 [Betaproteobacteria bacterium]|nr:hypothetical protein [Betaproteobacteria bacterium]